jgi:hypothetical protein
VIERRVRKCVFRPSFSLSHYDLLAIVVWMYLRTYCSFLVSCFLSTKSFFLVYVVSKIILRNNMNGKLTENTLLLRSLPWFKSHLSRVELKISNIARRADRKTMNITENPSPEFECQFVFTINAERKLKDVTFYNDRFQRKSMFTS